MLSYEIIDEEFVPVTVVKDIIKAKGKDAKYEQNLALEHAKKFSKLTKKQAEKLIADLKALDMHKLKEEVIIKITDILPQTPEMLKIVLSQAKISFKPEEIEQIQKIVNNYVK